MLRERNWRLRNEFGIMHRWPELVGAASARKLKKEWTYSRSSSRCCWVARRFGAPYLSLVALAGAALALVPGVPTLVLDPELALALFVAPVLAGAAFDASPRDLRRN